MTIGVTTTQIKEVDMNEVEKVKSLLSLKSNHEAISYIIDSFLLHHEMKR